MGNFKYFTKFPVYTVNKIYLIVTAVQRSRLDARANKGNVMGSTPTRAKFLYYVHEYLIYGLCSGI